jgi:hypothetical protein
LPWPVRNFTSSRRRNGWPLYIRAFHEALAPKLSHQSETARNLMTSTMLSVIVGRQAVKSWFACKTICR